MTRREGDRRGMRINAESAQDVRLTRQECWITAKSLNGGGSKDASSRIAISFISNVVISSAEMFSRALQDAHSHPALRILPNLALGVPNFTLRNKAGIEYHELEERGNVAAPVLLLLFCNNETKSTPPLRFSGEEFLRKLFQDKILICHLLRGKTSLRHLWRIVISNYLSVPLSRYLWCN